MIPKIYWSLLISLNVLEKDKNFNFNMGLHWRPS